MKFIMPVSISKNINKMMAADLTREMNISPVMKPEIIVLDISAVPIIGIITPNPALSLGVNFGSI